MNKKPSVLRDIYRAKDCTDTRDCIINIYDCLERIKQRDSKNLSVTLIQSRLASLVKRFEKLSKKEGISNDWMEALANYRKSLGTTKNDYTMITQSNYFDSTKSVDFSKLSPTLQEGHKFMTEYAEFYNDDADIKKAIDNHISILNVELSREKPKEEKPKKEPSPKKEKTPKQRKPKFKEGDKLYWRDNDDSLVTERIAEIGYKTDGEPVYTAIRSQIGNQTTWKYSESEIVESLKRKTMYLNQPAPREVHHIDPEVKFIKRYAALHGKRKDRESLLTLLHSLQKAINEKTITKTSKYADEVMAIQRGLIKAINAAGKEVDIIIDEDSLTKYRAIANGQKVIYSIPLLKQFIAITGKSNVKDKAEALLKRITEAQKKELFKSDPHGNEIKAVKEALEDYIAGKQQSPILSDISLRGLYGLCGIEPPAVKLTPGKVISSSDFVNARFTLLGFTGKWKRLIGSPSEPFKLMIYGRQGCGKSSLAIQFGYYMAKDHRQKSVMISKEEGFAYTLQEKVDRLNAHHPLFFVADELPKDLSPYSTIILDSVNTLNLTPQDMRELYKKYPDKNWVLLFQTTKDGKFRGENDFAHDVDAVFYCEDMVAYQDGKNRFGGKESIKIL